MTNELDAFRSVNFDWTRQLKSVWRDSPYHVPSLHQRQIDDIFNYFVEKTHDPDPADEPLGRVIVGPAGYGKTHLIGELRRRVWNMDGWFVLLDFVGVKEFWSSVALGFLNSLQVRMPDGKTQYDRLVLRIASLLDLHQELIEIANRFRRRPRELVTQLAALFKRSLARLYLQETGTHRDVVTALILLISEDLDCHSVAHAWLQGMNLETEAVRPLGFLGQNEPIKVVQGLSWLMSLVSPTLIAVDQIDPIVSASNVLARAANRAAEAEHEEAQSIVESLALGLIDLHERKRRAVTVISCLEATWKVLQDRATVAVTDRYNSPTSLRALPNRDIAEGLVTARLGQAYQACGFKSPYPTWPFTEPAFESAIDFSPRQLLKVCEAHRQHCVAQGVVTQCETFDSTERPPRSVEPGTPGLDQVFGIELKAATVTGLMDAEGEGQLQELLDGTLRLYEKHLDLPEHIDVEVQRDPDQKRPSLHGRLSFTFHNEGDREQHYCFRILGHTHATAFQSRLKAAMTASGIDTALKFRHLFILRNGHPPGGPKTAALVDQFRMAGGKFIAPTEDDLSAFVALRAMAQRDLAGFDAWLRTRRPLFDAPLFKSAGLCPPPFLASRPAPPEGRGPRAPDTGPVGNATAGEVGSERADAGSSHASGSASGQSRPLQRPVSAPAATGRLPQAAATPVAPRVIPIGCRFEGGARGETVTLAADALPRHVAILAGSGSGKTVMLRRIVEEAALLGIPAIVLDTNNDLARLGDAWPERPSQWSDEDAAKAKSFRDEVEVVVWTPGIAAGNPLSLSLLPDFSSLNDEDERSEAVGMAQATLVPFIGATGSRGQLKEGILADALRHFARSGGSRLEELADLLADLPDGVSAISNAQKLASQIADQLRAAMSINPLLQARGQALDPEVLFEGHGKTRISVINFCGLASDQGRQAFVNQLQMALFTWVKKKPAAGQRLYVLDEAQNFAPSQSMTPCKASTIALVSQARKYGLGMIFATQHPKGIDNKIISNCTTQFYGKMSAPTTIQAIRELMAAKGGATEDVGKLHTGEFYLSTDGFVRPVKIHTPLCLTYHPQNPLDCEEIVTRAGPRSKSGRIRTG